MRVPGAKAARRGLVIGAAVAALGMAGGARAQSAEFTSTVEAYLMGAAMSGTVGVGRLDADIDVPASTIFDHLKFAALVDYRGEAPEWAVAADVVYMNLGAHGTGSHGAVAAEVGVDELIVDVVGAYRFSPAFEVLGGARYTDLGTDVELAATSSAGKVKVDQSWVDPIVGAQLFVPLAEKLQLQARGDVGGFDVGCRFTWQATVRVNWQVSRAVRLGLGYRVLDQDYETGSGSDRFRWDVVSQGPLMAVAYTF
jgi:hypothetical protein